MTEGETLMHQLLKERGLLPRKHFWADQDVLLKLPDRGPLPDFYIEKDGTKLLIEVKDLEKQGPRRRDLSFQMTTPVQYQKSLEQPFRKAKEQLKPYAQELNIPTLVVFYDASGTHMLNEHTLGTLFGDPVFHIYHDPATGSSEGPFAHRGSGQQLNETTGTHISAIGVLGFELWNQFLAWANEDLSLQKPRIRILRNPHATLPAVLDIFNAKDDVIYPS